MKLGEISSICMSRQELHDLVWSLPLPEAAHRLGISRTWLAKICARAEVTYPRREYWEAPAGERTPREPLAGAHDLDEQIVLRPRSRAIAPDPDRTHHAEPSQHGRFEGLHPIVRAWREEAWRDHTLRKREPWRVQGRIPVSLDRRRLRLLDALLRELESRDLRLSRGVRAKEGLALDVDGARFHLIFEERYEPASTEPRDGSANAPPWTLPPAEPILALTVALDGGEPWRSWRDDAAQALENHLPEVAEAMAEHARAWQAPRAVGKPESKEAPPMQWPALEAVAEQWVRARNLRALACDLRWQIETTNPADISAEQRAWLERVEAFVESVERQTPTTIQAMMDDLEPPSIVAARVRSAT